MPIIIANAININSTYIDQYNSDKCGTRIKNKAL